VLVYLTYSDRIIEGSPKNSISVVPILPWPGSPADSEKMPNPGPDSGTDERERETGDRE